MNILDKGYRYQKNGLDFTMIQKDYEIVGKIHYLQAKCNICGKKIKLHQGQWANGTVTGCPSCLKKKPSKSGEEAPKSSTSSLGRIKPTVKIQPKQQEVTSGTEDFKIGKSYGNCKIESIRGMDITLTCQKCKGRIQLNKQALQNRLKSNIPLCECTEMEKVDVGLIKMAGPDNSKQETPYKELPGWIYITNFVDKKNTVYRYRCSVCGKIEDFRVHALLNKDCSCGNCKKLLKSKGQPVGSGDWTGFTTKCRRIELVSTNENGIRMASDRCLLCDDTEDIALISVIKEEIQVCDKCASRKLILNCPICGKNHLKNNLKGLYSGEKSDIICINKNEKIPKEQLVVEHDTRVRMQYITKKYRGRYTYQNSQGAKGDRAELIKFNEGYTGTDGKFYQSCMCVEHNKFLSLTEDEQGTYTHDFCDNDRMIPYNGSRALK